MNVMGLPAKVHEMAEHESQRNHTTENAQAHGCWLRKDLFQQPIRSGLDIRPTNVPNCTRCGIDEVDDIESTSNLLRWRSPSTNAEACPTLVRIHSNLSLDVRDSLQVVPPFVRCQCGAVDCTTNNEPA